MSSDHITNSLQPTCEECDSDDSHAATNRQSARGDLKPSTPFAPLPPPAQIFRAAKTPPVRLPSIASDSGYSSRTAATINSAESAQAHKVKVSTSQTSTIKPPQETQTAPLDVPEKKATSPPTSYKQAPAKRSISVSKTGKEKKKEEPMQQQPGRGPYYYRSYSNASRPAPTPLQTTYAYSQPSVVPTYAVASPAVLAPPSYQRQYSTTAPSVRRTSISTRPDSVNLVVGSEVQWPPPSTPIITQPQSYTLVEITDPQPLYYPSEEAYPRESRRHHSRRSESRRPREEASSSSRSKRVSVNGGALVTYGSQPIQDRSVSTRRSRSRDRKKKGKERRRERSPTTSSSSDEELDEIPGPSPSKQNALVRHSSRRESTGSSRPTYQKLKESYHEDSYRSSREPPSSSYKRGSTLKANAHFHTKSTPAVTTQTTVQRTSSRRESSSRQRGRSDPVVEETQDKMREAERHMQKVSVSHKSNTSNKAVVTPSAQPVVSSLTEQLLQEKTNPLRRPSVSASQRLVERSTAGSSRTGASQSRTDAGGSVRIRLDASKKLDMSFSGDVDFSLEEGIAELTVGGSKGKEKAYKPGGSSKSGRSFSERVSRRG